VNALNGTAVDRFLNFFLRGAGGVVDLGEILVVHTKDFRAEFGTKTARDALILVNHGNSGHVLLLGEFYLIQSRAERPDNERMGPPLENRRFANTYKKL
jgi:hypothetical protein